MSQKDPLLAGIQAAEAKAEAEQKRQMEQNEARERPLRERRERKAASETMIAEALADRCKALQGKIITRGLTATIVSTGAEVTFHICEPDFDTTPEGYPAIDLWGWAEAGVWRQDFYVTKDEVIHVFSFDHNIDFTRDPRDLVPKDFPDLVKKFRDSAMTGRVKYRIRPTPRDLADLVEEALKAVIGNG